MTPRVMAAWLFFAEQRHKRERSEKITLEFIANNASWDQIKEQQAEWDKE